MTSRLKPYQQGVQKILKYIFDNNLYPDHQKILYYIQNEFQSNDDLFKKSVYDFCSVFICKTIKNIFESYKNSQNMRDFYYSAKQQGKIIAENSGNTGLKCATKIIECIMRGVVKDLKNNHSHVLENSKFVIKKTPRKKKEENNILDETNKNNKNNNKNDENDENDEEVVDTTLELLYMHDSIDYEWSEFYSK